MAIPDLSFYYDNILLIDYHVVARVSLNDLNKDLIDI